MLHFSEKSLPKTLQSLKTTHSSSSSSSSVLHSRSCLLITILLLQIFLVSLSFSLHRHHHCFSSPTTTASAAVNLTINESYESQCELGKVYVYDLLPFFNEHILRDCDELNPWSSRCDALRNDGFGRRAIELAGIMPENLTKSWYMTDQFVSEIIFHNRISHHRCRMLEPRSAAAFYIPFYAGLVVGKFLWSNFDFNDRDRHCERLLDWVHQQPYWSRSNG